MELINKHTKRHPILLATREMQSKTNTTSIFLPIKLGKCLKIPVSIAGKNAVKLILSYPAGSRRDKCNSFEKQFGNMYQSLKNVYTL